MIYVIDGTVNPEPWTSPKVGRGSGKRAFMWSDPKLTIYKKALKAEFRELYPHVDELPKDEPFSVHFWFWRSTEKGNQCDRTNLVKATEDALQGVLYPNDKLNIAGYSRIVEQGPKVTPKIIIEVTKPDLRMPQGELIVPARHIERTPDETGREDLQSVAARELEALERRTRDDF